MVAYPLKVLYLFKHSSFFNYNYFKVILKVVGGMDLLIYNVKSHTYPASFLSGVAVNK